MATFGAGPWPYGAGGSYWIQLQIDDPPAVIGPEVGSVTLSARLMLYTSGALNDSVNQNSIAGSLGSGSWSAGVSHGAGGGGTQVASVTASVATVEGSPVVVSVQASISGYEALGVQSVSGQVVIPARQAAAVPPGKPGAPGLLSRTATRIDVEWAAPASDGGAPVLGYDLRWSTGTPSGTGIAVGGRSYAIQGLSPNTSYNVQARAKNAAGTGDWGPVAVHATLPNAPAAPTSVAAARVSDTQHTITWSASSTSAAPIDSQRVQRLLLGTSSWMTVATVGGAVRSYSDTTTTANAAYQWRIVAVNAAGSSTSAASALRYTTPADPTGAAATRSGSNIVVSWSQAGVGLPASTEVYESVNGGAWALRTTVAYGVTSWTHVAPSEVDTHAYRVRHRTTVSPVLYSGFSTTETVQLAAPPAAPTNLGPGGPHDATEDVALAWRHNPVDASAQVQAQVRRRLAGNTSWVQASAVSSSVEGLTVQPDVAWGASNGDTWEWQVRTRGIHPTFSPWSDTSTITFSARPTVTVTPVGVHPLSRLTVGWTYYDPEATEQAAWEVLLRDEGGTVVESRSGVGTASSVALATVLEDDTAWSVWVRVRDGVGLWSAWDSSIFAVSYLPPPAPVVVPVWDPEAGTVVLNISTPPAGAGQDEAESVDVRRSIAEGPWELIATGAPPAVTVTDWAAPLAGSVRYRATAVSALGAVQAGPAVGVVPVGAQAVMVSAGPGLSVVCRAVTGAQVTDHAARERALRAYAGRSTRVAHEGELVTRVLTLTATVPDREEEGSTWDEWHALALLPGPHLWRDPDGRYLRVTIRDGAELSRAVGGGYTMTLTCEVTDE